MLRNTVQKDITERLFDFKSVWSKNCAVFRTAWLATDTNCKDEKSQNFKIFFSQRHYICSRLRIHWHKCPHWNRPVPNIAQKYNKYLRLKKCQNSRDKDHWETWKIVEILRLKLCGKSNGNTHRTMLKSETGREKKRCNKVEAKVQFHEKKLGLFYSVSHCQTFLILSLFHFKE